MTTPPLVSIIMNCYNGEKYLQESLQSVFTQTYENWELIFWDNLSSDSSKEILEKHQDRRIKYFCSKRFLNLYEARNHALKEASGKYVCFLDVDDLYEKEKIDLQVKFLEENEEFKMVYSNYFTLDEQIKKKFVKLKFNLPTGKITRKILRHYTVGIINTLLKREIFEKDIFMNKYNIIGDFDFFVRISRNIKIGCIQKPLATYRLHAKNYSKLKVKVFHDELKSWIKENEEDFNNAGYTFFYQKIYLFKLKVKILCENFFLKN